ncbi:MAG: hypothetical protein H0V00_13840 [Chloroflexia bacterium]|nr:hypothetical protein [Chloroflexia bacterium]
MPEERSASSAQPLVEILHIEGDLPGDLALARPVRVEIWIENDEFVADVADLNLHAFGVTRDEALTSVRVQIVENYQRFKSLGGRLSPLMSQEAAQFEEIVLPRHA